MAGTPPSHHGVAIVLEREGAERKVGGGVKGNTSGSFW